MASKQIHFSIDLPRDLHHRLHEFAAREGCTARKVMLEGIERMVAEVEASGLGERSLERKNFDSTA